MMRSKPFYIFGVLLLTVILVVSAFFCLTTFGAEWRKEQELKMWKAIFEKIDWSTFPWDDIPWEKIPDDFPWDAVPWRDLPWDQIVEQVDWQNFPYDKVPWEDMPEDFPYELLPWDEMPRDFPYADVPWQNMPEDFPYDQVDWENMPEDFWETFPWEDMPPDFPWILLPWALIHPELVPDGVLPDDFYPQEWDHEHQYATEYWLPVVAPTCGTAGEEQNFCIICKKMISREVPPTGEHTFADDAICSVCHKRKIILISQTKTKVYDGLPLDGAGELTFLEGSASLLEGHFINYDAITFVTRSAPGSMPNSFTLHGSVIVDGNGNNVTSDYVIETRYGMLSITQQNITVTTASDRKSYDGRELRNDTYVVDGLLNGHSLTDVVFDEGQTDYGTRENVILDFRIIDQDGNDVTDCYNVTFEFGWLTVTK